MEVDNAREKIISPDHSKKRYEVKREGVKGVSKKNSNAIKQHLHDLEVGRNVK